MHDAFTLIVLSIFYSFLDHSVTDTGYFSSNLLNKILQLSVYAYSYMFVTNIFCNLRFLELIFLGTPGLLLQTQTPF